MVSASTLWKLRYNYGRHYPLREEKSKDGTKLIFYIGATEIKDLRRANECKEWHLLTVYELGKGVVGVS